MKKLNAYQMLTACGSHLLKLALSLTLIAAMNTSAYADCQMNCNQNVQVSLDNDCEATITYKTMLQDPDNPALCTPNGASAYVVTVMAADGTPIGDKLTKQNLVDGWCGVTYLVKVKHWASGNICWGSIYVEDKIAPYGKAEDFEIYCYEDKPTLEEAFWNYAHIDDNCEHAEIVDGAITALSEECDPFLLADGYCAKFAYKYTVKDKCGNTAIFDHHLYVKSVDPVIPGKVEIKCNEVVGTGPEYTGYPTLGGHPIRPGVPVGHCKWAADYEDWVIPICDAGGSKKIIRTWKLVNVCEHKVVEEKQEILIYNAGPWVDPLPEEALWLGTNNGSHTCDYYGPLPIPPYRAECAPIVKITATVFTYDVDKGYQHPTPVVSGVDVLAGEPVRIAKGGFVVYYDFFDECHAKTLHEEYGVVYDATPPVAIADTYTTLDLAAAGFDDDECVTSLHAYDLDSGSYDNCRGVTLEVARKDAAGNIGSFGHKVNFTADDACSEQLVVLRVCEDQNGTEGKDEVLCSQVWITVEVQDSYIAFERLYDKEIPCSGDDEWNAEDAFDTPRLIGCSAEIIDVRTVADPANCGDGSYTRYWTAENCKGIQATMQQTIHVYYEGSVYGLQCPPDRDYDCGGGLTVDDLTEATTGRPTFNTTGCGFGSLSEPYDEVFRHEGEGDGCFKIKRYWELIDWCNGGTYVDGCYQLITVTDKDVPLVSCDDVDLCITDGCDVSFQVPAPTIDDCTATTTTVDWDFVGKFGDTQSGTTFVGRTVNFGPGVLTLKYIVRDACGNYGNATCTVTITDCKDPTPFCRDVGTALMNNGTITIWASDFLLYAEDNCDDAAMVESTVKMRLNGTDDTPTTSITLTCDDLFFSGGFAGVQVDIIVYDMAGNSDFCTAPFQIQNNNDNCADFGEPASIITSFNDETGESVEEVTVKLSGGDMNETLMTGATGFAQFANIPMHGDYEVAGEKDMNLLNGVSTYDVVVLTRHILGITKLNSPYKLIAADVNGSGSISTGDVLALRRAILAITDDFGSNPSWRFVDASYTFPDPTNPFLENFPEKLSILDLDHDMNAEFISVKIGDLNNNAIPHELLGTPSFEGAAMVMGLEDVKMTAGQTYDIEFKSKDFDQFGYQFTLGFDKNAITVNDVNAGALEGLSQNNFGMQLISEGAITTSWDNPNGVQLADDNTIFTLSVTAHANTTLSEVLSINSSITPAEAVNGDLEATDVELEFYNKKGAQFELFQNTPNPFSGETLIEFSLPEADQVTFQVFDVAGKVLMERTQNMNRGLHQIRLTKADLGATGVLYYQVETSKDVATKKMITLE